MSYFDALREDAKKIIRQTVNENGFIFDDTFSTLGFIFKNEEGMISTYKNPETDKWGCISVTFEYYRDENRNVIYDVNKPIIQF